MKSPNCRENGDCLQYWKNNDCYFKNIIEIKLMTSQERNILASEVDVIYMSNKKAENKK